MSANFNAYKIFYFVGRYRNITQTANALYLSQSTVSRCIQNLEAELGCRLFERSQQGVTLTKRGELLYSHISRACDHIFLGEELLRQAERGDGVVRINVSEFFLWQFMTPVLEEFYRDNPGVCVQLATHTLGTQEAAMESLANGMTDAVCTMAPILTSVSGISVSEIASFHDVLIAGPGFERLGEGEWSLSELESFPFAAVVARQNSPSLYDKLFAMQGLDVIPAFRVDTSSFLLPLVRRGLCLAFIPEAFMSQFSEQDGIFQVHLKDEIPNQSICIATNQADERPPALASLIDRICTYARSSQAFDNLPG